MAKFYVLAVWTFLLVAMQDSTQLPVCSGKDYGESPPYEDDVDADYKTMATGNPCSRYEEGDLPQTAREVTFASSKRVTISYRSPARWAPGKYVCVWNVKILPVAGNRYGLKVFFRRMSLSSLEDGKCKDKLSINHVNSNTTYSSDGFCRKENRFTYRTGWKTLQLRLEVVIPYGGPETGHRTSFAAVFSSNSRWEYEHVTFFKVSDIINAHSPVKGFDYTWQEARDFCQQHGPGMDLCYAYRSCPDYRVPFPRKLKDKTLQYHPTLNSYNSWVEVKAPRSCQFYYKEKLPHDYAWGVNKTMCPKNGCESKSHLYCCFYSEPEVLCLIPEQIPVHTYAVQPGKYAYRFPESQNMDIDYHDLDQLSWDLNWKEVGRIEGDVTKFQLFFYYSPDYPTPVYFCTRHGEYRDAKSHRFMASLQPCSAPWKLYYYMFGSKVLRPNLTAIYFGYHSLELGSRVSVTPPCCGYDKPEHTFVIYGVVKDEWKADVKSLQCDKKSEFTGPSGTISSPLYPAELPQYMDCKWTIRVQHGHGILVNFGKRFDGQWGCNIWFTDPTSERLYGKACYQNLPAQFITYSNVLEISLLNEDETKTQFTFNYTEVDHQASPPRKFSLPNEEATWSSAEALCEGNKMQLCKRNEMCPFSTHVMEDSNDQRWIAVRDQYNDWVFIESSSQLCEFHLETHGPPTWGDVVLDKAGCNSTGTEENPVKEHCKINRAEVYCCQLSKEDTARQGSFYPVLEKLDPVRVIMGYEPRYGAYWFKKSDEWLAPHYYPYHYYGSSLSELYRRYPWKPPGSIGGAKENVVDYFTLSSKYMKGHFEQAVYFCWVEEYDKDYEKSYFVSLEGCGQDLHYRTVHFDFSLYAGKKESDLAKIPLHFGKASENGKVCCEKNKKTFTIYVLDAGQEDSYEDIAGLDDY